MVWDTHKAAALDARLTYGGRPTVAVVRFWSETHARYRYCHVLNSRPAKV